MFSSLIPFGFVCTLLFVHNTKSTIVPQRKTQAEESPTPHDSKFDKEVLFHGITEEDVEDDDDDAVFKLPLGEQKARLKKLVEKRIDADHDGFVDHIELENWSIKALDDFETQDTRRGFPNIDKNVDELISWKEYVTDTFGKDFSEETNEFKNPDTKEWKKFVASYQRDKQLFDICDKDNDKQLNLKEYVIFKHPRLDPETRLILVEDALRTSDVNKDGKIDLKEFLGNFKKNMDDSDPQWTEIETDKFEDVFDANNDGFLTGDEIALWIAQDNREEAKEEAHHLIGECDTNGDSKLTVSEILNNHELWLESDATDFGRQLLKHRDEL